MDTSDMSVYDSPGAQSRKRVYDMMKKQNYNFVSSSVILNNKNNMRLTENFNKIKNKLIEAPDIYPENLPGIVKLMDGLTVEMLKKKFPWILKAKKDRAVIGISANGNIVWHSGNWLDGTWKNGVWKGNGNFEKGAWLDGSWNGGEFNGKWRRGTFRAGRFGPKGEWLGGTFEHGTFYGNWRGGKWMVNRPGFWQPTAKIKGKVSKNPPQLAVNEANDLTLSNFLKDKVKSLITKPEELKVEKMYVIHGNSKFQENCKLIEKGSNFVFDCEGSLKDDDNEFFFTRSELNELIKDKGIYEQK